MRQSDAHVERVGTLTRINASLLPLVAVAVSASALVRPGTGWPLSAALLRSPHCADGLYNWGERVDEAHMNESIIEMERLLKEVISHVQADTKADKRKAAVKLERMASLASTLALMLNAQR